MTPTTKCAIWARVSTHDQETENQLRELREWAQRRGFKVVKIYQTEASASKGHHKPLLDEALQDARLGKYEVLLCWALDRLSGEGVEATLGLLRRFHGYGVPVWSLQEAWTETADPRMAELLGSIYAWMAAEESRRRSERIRAGLERRKAAGLPVGRQPGAVDKAKRKRSGYVKRYETARRAS